jgi:hypothetical protein
LSVSVRSEDILKLPYRHLVTLAGHRRPAEILRETSYCSSLREQGRVNAAPARNVNILPGLILIACAT